ncbi:MAG: caspase family protein, partial [SAR324 cluster bacterium]|nr:caspase family protein [SAR324 cluster bacterium]
MRRRSQLHETLGWLLLTLAVFLSTLPDLAAESRGVKRVEIKTAAGEAIGLYEQSHALVIGVSAYEHWPKLPGVKRDVTDVAAALEKNGFAVQTVLDPDQDALDDAFESFIEEHGGNPENRLLFYFAGHGHTVQPKFGGEPLGYLVPTDAPVPTLGKREQRRFKRVAMGMQRIEEYALNIDAKHALFLFDACFSGS